MQEPAENGPLGGDKLPSPMPQRNQQIAALDPRMQALSTLARGGEDEFGEKDVDLLEYWRVIAKRKWTVLAVFAIVLLTGIMVTMLTTPIFRATATLQIERQANGVVRVPGIDSGDVIYDPEFYETQFQLLRSRSMAEKVAADLDPNEPVFAVMSAPSPLGKLLYAVLGVSQPDVDAVGLETRRRQLVSLVQSGLSVEPVKGSRLVRINFDSPDGPLSAKIANAVAEGFIESNMERRISQPLQSIYGPEPVKITIKQARLLERQQEVGRRVFVFSQHLQP